MKKLQLPKKERHSTLPKGGGKHTEPQGREPHTNQELTKLTQSGSAIGPPNI